MQSKLATFSGTVSLVRLPAGTEIYRTVGLTASQYGVDHGTVTNKLLGDFWEPTSPNEYADVSEWRSTTAVLAEWNGNYGHIAVRLSTEVLVLSGTVAEQKINRQDHGVLPGGGHQYYIPGLKESALTEVITSRPIREVIRETKYKKGRA